MFNKMNNLMLMRLTLVFYFIVFSTLWCSAQEVDLFNGKDLTGWHWDVPEMDKDKDARNPFIVRNGMLVSLGKPGGHRSEEHTSELQSRENLVCRLLLEKK